MSENAEEKYQPAELNSVNNMSQVEDITPLPAAVETMRSNSASIASPIYSSSANVPIVAPSSSTSVTPSEGCGCAGGSSFQLVYALGELDFDFGTEARLDYFAQSISPSNPTRAISKANFLNYLTNNPWEAQSFNWVLKLDATPIYAIAPSGLFANLAYERLRLALEDKNVERVSIPGYLAGGVRLMSGQVVPMIIPEVRGMYSWNVLSILDSLTQSSSEELSSEDLRSRLLEYLTRIYYDFRNLGITPQERALNFSATNAFQVREVIAAATIGGLSLDTIQVEKSPICRPDSECYDVKLQFFDPENSLRSMKVFRFTIDVSDVVPVTVGQFRSWSLAGHR